MSSCQGLVHPRLHQTQGVPTCQGAEEEDRGRAANRERPHQAWGGKDKVEGNTGIWGPW